MEEIAFYDETILVLQPVESEIKAYLETHDYLNLDPEINDSTWMMAFNSDTNVLIDKLKTTGDPVIDNADLDKKTYITLSGFFSSLVDRYIGYTGAFGGGDKDEHKMEDVFSAYHFIHIHQYQLLRRLERFVQIGSTSCSDNLHTPIGAV